MVTMYALPNAFVKSDYLLALYLNQVRVWFMKSFASATLFGTRFVVSLYSKLRYIQLSLRTLCNM
jgi:lipid-A-disaccharide synthase-like uncharacterized protein